MGDRRGTRSTGKGPQGGTIMKKIRLIPPDLKQCQAEKPNRNDFMTLGGPVGHVRCTNKPFYIATERKAPKGSMSLCIDCQVVCEEQMPGRVTYKEIVVQK